ncbi:ABC transporter permease [Paenibacillus sp. MMS20-IR301]|uniref:ABC transporter permease n=1 Tax=Paenibacillus sp. MMS20-IR301 TaxID=2895946 RepID=UPI0028E1ABF4|nr:ABC transporter permease [Paenibacillus sp. MMS20-IR301]WNS44081.1 ABC transporter permease [Paenibacillus sp. MMS20-IR301]
MVNLLRSELYKLYKEPSFRMLIFTFIILAVLLSAVINYMGSSQKVFSGIAGLGYGIQVNVLVLKISLAVVGGFFLSGEHGLGIMKISAASGYSRRQIYTAKLAAYAAGIIILMLTIPVICTAAGSVLNGFGSLPDLHAALYFLRTLAFTILYSAAFASIVAVFAVTTTISGVTIGAVLLVLLFFDTISEWLSSKSAMYKTFYEHTVFKLFLEIGNFQLTAHELALLILIPIATILLFAWAGIMSFRKMEIK